jgi:hypothetical protein
MDEIGVLPEMALEMYFDFILCWLSMNLIVKKSFTHVGPNGSDVHNHVGPK